MGIQEGFNGFHRTRKVLMNFNGLIFDLKRDEIIPVAIMLPVPQNVATYAAICDVNDLIACNAMVYNILLEFFLGFEIFTCWSHYSSNVNSSYGQSAFFNIGQCSHSSTFISFSKYGQ